MYCPLDCEYLQEARRHEKLPELKPDDVPHKDIEITEQFLHDNTELLLHACKTLFDAAMETHGVVDSDALGRIARDVSTLFSKDAIWDGGSGLGICRGRQAIYERFREPTLKFSWHYFVKPRIDVDGDRARGSWDILAPCTSRDDRLLWMAGTEEDEYVRQGGLWLHSSMKLRVIFMAPHDRGWAKR